MRKALVLLMLVMWATLLAGCSWKNSLKWIDKLDWERDDQTVRSAGIGFR
jgi:outer membrane lipopolysaccharide assembly protein LptE/RlpB